MRLPVASYVFIAGLILFLAAPAGATTGAGFAAEPFLTSEASLTGAGVCAAPHDPEVAGIFVRPEPPASAPPVPSAGPAPVPPPLDDAGGRVFDAEAYGDVYAILREENECSRFFGGPAESLEVFNEFARRLEKKPLGGRGVVLRMEGTYANYLNVKTGAAYRIFERAFINTAGPVFRRDNPLKSERLRVGRFPADTRQARSLVLLHELGHLVEGQNGHWLLPNDGADAELSERNTRKIEEQCLNQLLALER